MEVIKNGQGSLEFSYRKGYIHIQNIYVGGQRGVGNGRDLLEKFREQVGRNQKISGEIAHQVTVVMIYSNYGHLAIAQPNSLIKIQEIESLPIAQIFASAGIAITSVGLMYVPEIKTDDIHEQFHRPFLGHT